MEVISRFVADAPAPTREVLERLTRLAAEAAPAFEIHVDGVKVSFSFRGQLVFGVFPLRSHVTLGFFRADGLPDPGGMLAGAGGARHARFHARTPLDEQKLRELLMAAARLAAS